MSLFDKSKSKDKKKGNQQQGKSSFIPQKGKGSSKSAAKNARMPGRSQRGS
ncbi:MAG: hypothetical protein SFU87_01740 [Chitinophagaceae bacterium]|nr:hypothetical protein [Chitinophagaceae bacterium]